MAGVKATRLFFDEVYALVRAVPAGKVTTYGTIAYAMGAPGSARLVGYALAALHGSHEVPAHRVVNRSGILTGERAFGPPGIMRALLEAEGVRFCDDGRVDLDRHLCVPRLGEG